MKFIRHILVAVVLIVCTCSVEAQIYLGESQNININYQNPKTYEIGGITISGVQYLEHSTLIGFTGLHVGDKIDIPGQKISKAIDKLWRQGLFEDIRIEVTKVQGNLVFLNIDMKERPRISTVAIEGIKKSELTDLKGQIGLTRGDVVSENTINNAKNAIRTYFIDKGYYNIDIDVVQEDDPLVANSKFLSFKITKKFTVLYILVQNRIICRFCSNLGEFGRILFQLQKTHFLMLSTADLKNIPAIQIYIPILDTAYILRYNILCIYSISEPAVLRCDFCVKGLFIYGTYID